MKNMSRHTDFLCELETSLLMRGIQIREMSKLDVQRFVKSESEKRISVMKNGEKFIFYTCVCYSLFSSSSISFSEQFASPKDHVNLAGRHGLTGLGLVQYWSRIQQQF
jgi:hypothetical protein